MRKTSFFKIFYLGTILFFSIAFIVGMNGTASAACKNRGDLDTVFCDEDGDLLADTPKSADKWLDPATLVFSYTAVEDPSVYENVFSELMEHIEMKTGKKVKWYGPESYAAQVEAMRSGRLHISGFAAGATVYGVNLGGFHPQAMMGNKDGTFRGYKLWLITHRDSDIYKVTDLKGRKIAHVTPSSNSGNQAPRALFKNMGVVPDVDYKVIYSGKHDNSIMGVVNKDYDAAPVASTVMQRMMERGIFEPSEVRIIWESDQFPGTSYGCAYNLAPKLQEKVREAFLTFDWTGSGLAKDFGKRADSFIPVDYIKHWKVIRTIQKENNVIYTQDALKTLKAGKKKKKKK
ncbi:MAG TPA: phosphate/phosphite/phosphonate ABC transporter substrate-binding protein [Thermodesulforhabdus norvegica]|uniref:Phosphate/phosphite/phosphonate ABC transporter substrate-binding protein n=1 Tax=Thermodesulforhabdus norvegica TaxID=39841 RepID=A0A7C1AXB1_9BACT|nr:MAG: phosphate/phosphite/phosphonate ABC transporter substrate-binding protein [Deltaproteobacteria bacterium]RLC14666.1 MAG: phosphate/phosphite/phosphonate ABC transporter substrate-binding protein [Deltaproteobacteria bacterium]HDL89376.1 phosphate/phosphite/phosphonate ABC transporter substrate-binding protein [Thermodesulforhabdus norvegica]